MGKIKHKMLNAKAVRNASGVLNIIKGTTGVRPGNSGILVIIKLHGTADTAVAVTEQKLGGDA